MTRKTLILHIAPALLATLCWQATATGQNFNRAKDLAREVVGQAQGGQQADAPAEPQHQAAPAETPQDEGPLTVEQIVARTNYVSYYQGLDGRAQVKMTITDAQGRQRIREFTILRRDQQAPDTQEPAKDSQFTGEQKFYLYFHAPADVNKMVFMVHKHLDRDDDRWLYLPDLDLVKRIAAADKRTSFVGSNFLYEDVSGRNIDADEHELVEAESDADYYVLKNTPKDPGSVEFAYYKMWIHRKTFVVVQTRYYDKQDQEYRRYEALKVDKNPQFGYSTVTKSKMSDLRDGGHTEMEYANVTYNMALPDELFSERFLRRAPMKFLK